MFRNPFSNDELARRVTAVRAEMAARDLDIAIFSAPESVFYLTGLDHWGYFAPHHLIVPAVDEMVLVTRAMERVTVENQVRNARFSGHADSATPASHLATELAALNGKNIGFETTSPGFTFAAGKELAAALGATTWADISDLTDILRLVKSPEEQALMRAAARASDAGTEAAIVALHDGAREVDVAAECIAAMIRAGSNPPGFGPFIRPAHRIAEEHTTWGDGTFRKGGKVLLELAGCVSRYHAPMGRLIHLGSIRDEDAAMAEVALRAFEASFRGLRPGRKAREVYADWQAVVDDAGMPHYRRHHCGYLVGLSFPPTWTGGNTVTGLRHDSDLEIRAGMAFHLLSWFTETGRGDFFVSNCALLGPEGPELLTTTPMGPTVI